MTYKAYAVNRILRKCAIRAEDTKSIKMAPSELLGSNRAAPRAGSVDPEIPLQPQGEVGVSGLRALDLKLSWIHKFHERFAIEPNVAFYNLFNFTNFDLPPNVIGGLLTGSAGSVNGTTQANRITKRV